MAAPPDRTQALRLYAQLGAAEAARRIGVSTRTLNRWAKDAGQVSHDSTQKTEEARAAAATRVATVWADFRSREATAAGALAAALRGAIRGAIPEDGPPDGRNLQALAIAYGILIDKAELLSDHATARIEHWAESELDRDLKALVTEMEARIRG